MRVDLQAMMYESPSGNPEGTTMFTCPAVMEKPLARGVSDEGVNLAPKGGGVATYSAAGCIRHYCLSIPRRLFQWDL